MERVLVLLYSYGREIVLFPRYSLGRDQPASVQLSGGASAQMFNVYAVQDSPDDWNGNPVSDILRWAVRSVLGAPQSCPRSDLSGGISVYRREWLALARELGFPPSKVQQWVQDDVTLQLIVDAYCARSAIQEPHFISPQD